uniref:Unpaired 2 n=2 Tax=Drosophila melanogaster TaxID=7227 RepID=Q9VWX2_DROME|nr:unpaired 2 [Drosophila melanogaster]AAF48815.3 unpaired 2 [Drosophila melanogaster]
MPAFTLNASQQSQSSRSSRSAHSSWSCHSRQVLLVIMILSVVMPFTKARHLRDQVALDYAYDEDNSGRSSSSSSSSSSSGGDILPAFDVNPYRGLADSFGEGSYDSDMSLSESSYEEIAQAAIRAARREMRRQRTRHARSHNLRLFSGKSEIPEWENPCGGTYTPDESLSDSSASQGRVIKRKHLENLRNITMSEYQDITHRATLEYGNLQHWQREYKFLPNMTRPTSAVKLKTWYRHMQTFVGSFSYLGRAQYKFRKDQQKSLNEAVTKELHDLLVSARYMLCEIELTINASYPNSNGAKLSRVSRQAMEERLNFHTPANGSMEADQRDLKVSKELYFQYLNNVWKTLHRVLRRPRRNSAERRHLAAIHGTGASGLRAGSSEMLDVGSSNGSGGSSGSDGGSNES